MRPGNNQIRGRLQIHPAPKRVSNENKLTNNTVVFLMGQFIESKPGFLHEICEKIV